MIKIRAVFAYGTENRTGKTFFFVHSLNFIQKLINTFIV